MFNPRTPGPTIPPPSRFSFIKSCESENEFFRKVLWVLQPPVNSDLLNGSRKVLTNDLLWQFNTQAYRVLEKSSILVWSSLYRYIIVWFTYLVIVVYMYNQYRRVK